MFFRGKLVSGTWFDTRGQAGGTISSVIEGKRAAYIPPSLWPRVSVAALIHETGVCRTERHAAAWRVAHRRPASWS